MKTWDTNLENMVYIVRDEGIKPMGHLYNICDINKLTKAQNNFIEGLMEMLQSQFRNARVIRASVEEQTSRAYEKLKVVKTISMDTYFTGTHNLDITRLFEVVNGETKFCKITNRKGTKTIEEQIESLRPGAYVLVDDDAVGGATIRAVKEMVKAGVEIVDTYLLMDIYRSNKNEPILDVVDCRDFLAGMQLSGLTVTIDGVDSMRVPYMYPFVDIEDKANILDENAVDVSKRIWELNKKFWAELGANVTLGDTEEDFIEVSKIFNIGKETLMSDVCDKYKVLAEQGVLLSTHK